MGRKTWDSIPKHLRPLKNRLNVVLTKSPKEFLEKENQNSGSNLQNENLVVVTDFKEALENLSQDEGIAEIFVVGGSSLYDLSMDQYKEYCKLIIATRINKLFECDTFITKKLENHTEM